MPVMDNKPQYRFFEFERSAVNVEQRTVELTFSSEIRLERWYGTEILDHSPESVDLSRLNQIGVLLFNHDPYTVIGRIERAWIDEAERKCRAIVRFDEDETSEVIFQKVVSGTLRGTSVWYDVQNWEEVAAGEKSLDGRFDGPCYIARKWMPYEISIVSIPADPTVGVGRFKDTVLQQILDTQRQILALLKRDEPPEPQNITVNLSVQEAGPDWETEFLRNKIEILKAQLAR